MKEETKTLKINKLKTIGLLLISILFIITNIFYLEKNLFRAWFGIIFFSICMVVFVIQLIPNSSYLKLTKNGFEIRSIFKSNYIKWSEVETFKAGYVVRNKMVMYNFSKEYKKYNIGKKISKFLASNEGALPDTYGMKATDLAELMNKWKSESNNI